MTQRRRQRNIYLASGSGLAVIAAIAVVLGVVLSSGGGPGSGSSVDAGTFALTGALTQADVAKVEDVPVGDLIANATAAAEVNTKLAAQPLQKMTGKPPALSVGGKPEILYIGGEYCPYCANERWAMVMALSKFGTFSGLSGTTSSSTDVYPGTPTFSFYKSSYTSKYISFVGVEWYKNSGENTSTGVWPTLQAPTSQQLSIINTYDAPPYVSTSAAGGIPFVYMDGKFVLIGPQYVDTQLSSMQWDSAAQLLTAGNNSASKNAEAAAGFLVGEICAISNGRPASVCSQVPKDLIGISTSSPKIKVVSKTPSAKKS
ncbi:MAG TPA: DUF929 family protein [Acidimicrobiales bacterium]|nr:DUF929 family protein [Acidimicrobiales bacterium]